MSFAVKLHGQPDKGQINFPFPVSVPDGWSKPEFTYIVELSREHFDVQGGSLHYRDSDGLYLCTTKVVAGGLYYLKGYTPKNFQRGETTVPQLLACDEMNQPWLVQDMELLTPGSTVRHNNEDWMVPSWLKISLPCSVTGQSQSLVDLSLPIKQNPFNATVQEFLKGTKSQEKLSKNSSHDCDYHLPLIGASGCGKTATCFAQARDRYLLYMVLPSHQSEEAATRSVVSKACTLDPALWSRAQFKDSYAVHAELYRAVAARLVVLKNRLEFGDLAPTDWLLYCLSEAGDRHINTVHTEMRHDKVTIHHILKLVEGVHSLQEQYKTVQSGVMLVLDNVEHIAHLEVKEHCTLFQMSLMAALNQVLALLPFPVIYSGTHSGPLYHNVHHKIGGDYGYNHVQPIGEYKYFTNDEVKAFLESIIRISPKAQRALKQCCHSLQGRASTLTGFVTFLLDTTENVLKFTKDELTGPVLTQALTKYMETHVVHRFRTEISRQLQGKVSTEENVGFLWRISTLPMESHADIDYCDRIWCIGCTNTLAFTARVERADLSMFKSAFLYRNQYSEPGLIQALSEYVRDKPEVRNVTITEERVCPSPFLSERDRKPRCYRAAVLASTRLCSCGAVQVACSLCSGAVPSSKRFRTNRTGDVSQV